MSIILKDLADDSPLSLAGLKAGDIITYVNVWPVSDARSFKKAYSTEKTKSSISVGSESTALFCYKFFSFSLLCQTLKI